MNRLIYSWENLKEDIKSIISDINIKGWNPDVIVGIKRGGVIPATILSHFMNLPLHIISCQLRDGEDKDKNLDLSELLLVSEKNKFLFVDDICDTGETFKKIYNSLHKNNIKEFKTCSLFFNIRQKFIVDFKARKIDRNENKDWVVFPWEV